MSSLAQDLSDEEYVPTKAQEQKKEKERAFLEKSRKAKQFSSDKEEKKESENRDLEDFEKIPSDFCKFFASDLAADELVDIVKEEAY